MAEEREREKVREELEKMLRAALMSETDAMPPQGQGQIISPVDITRLLKLFRDMPLDLEQESLERIDPLRRELNTIVTTLQKISSELVTRQLEDGLAWIYHPVYGDSVAAARIRQLIHVLAASVRRMWYYIAENYGKMSPNELREAVETAELATKLSFLVISDTWAKIMTLFFTNAPPPARPPLANAALGYELVHYGNQSRQERRTILSSIFASNEKAEGRRKERK